MAGVCITLPLASQPGGGVWFVAAIGVFMAGPTSALLANQAIRRSMRRAKAADYRLCPGCAYDLRDLGESGACPECGLPFQRSAVRAR